MTAAKTNRVVITGLSAVTPMGMGVQSSFSNMLKGINNVQPYKPREVDFYTGKWGVPLHPDYKEEEYLTTFGPIRIFSLTNALGKNVLIDSFGSIDNLPTNVQRFGSMVTTIYETLANSRNVQRKGENVRSRDNFAGCNFYTVFTLHLNYSLNGYADAAAVSIGDAYRKIKHDENDIMIAGGLDWVTNEIGYSTLKQFGVIDNEGENFKVAPYDKSSQGVAPGAGGGFMILESLDSALQRNAKIYGEIVGYANNSHGKFNLKEFGDGQETYDAISSALEEAKVDASDIDFIDGSATSCKAFDLDEINGIKRVIKEAKGGASKLKVSGFGSYSGFTGLANESIGSVMGIQALNEKQLPKILNLENPLDEAQGLKLAIKENSKGDYKYFVKHNIGTGGYNTAIVFKSFQY